MKSEPLKLATPASIFAMLEWAITKLPDQAQPFSSESPRLDAEILLASVLDVSRAYLKTWPEKKLSPEQQKNFQALIVKRQQGQPVAYLLGEWEFWSLPIKVTPDTLIPRPETERLVELALEKCTLKVATVADLGTGSGAIALALATENPAWSLFATDISPKALAIATANATALGLNNINFFAGSWFSALPDTQFDLIVSNPPYIAQHDPQLQSCVINWEPKSALIAEAQGLADLAAIISQAPLFLKPGAWLILEHGYNQGVAVASLFQQHGYGQIITEQDLEGRDRVSCGQWPA